MKAKRVRSAQCGMRNEVSSAVRAALPFRTAHSALRIPSSHRPPTLAARSRSGVVLLIVLIVVAMLAVGAYSFVQLMNMEARGANSYGRLVQAREAADSGVQYAAAILADQKANGALGTDLYDSASVFQGQTVSDDSANQPRQRCRFSVVAFMDGNDASAAIRYGVIDEAGKINLNAILQLVQSAGTQTGAGTGGGSGAAAGGGSGATNPLLYLPNMTPEIADAILDWIDSDDEPRTNGAESDYYLSLNPPYQARNGPLHSLDELLLVQGITPRLLYGEDANYNGVLDPNEDDGDQSQPSDDANGTLDRGWLPYLTIHSHESNTDVAGLARINLNNQDAQALYDQLTQDPDFGEEKAKFIVAYRLFGPAQDQQQQNQSLQPGQQQQQGQPQAQQTGQQQGQPTQQQSGQQPKSTQQPGQTQQGSQTQQSQGQSSQNQQPSQSQSSQDSSGSQPAQTVAGMDASGGAKQTIQSVIDLIGARVNVKMPGQNQTVPLQSPFAESDMADYLDLLLDRTTTIQGSDLVGRINVKTAPSPVLMALPEITEELANAISGARTQSSSSIGDMSNTGISWLLTTGTVTKDQFKKIEPYITGRSQVYRVQVVGYFEEGGPVGRVEAVIDVSGSSPRIRYWRDLSQHGRGFDPQVLLGTVNR